MSEQQWNDVRQRLRAANEQFRRGLQEISNDQTLRRAMPPTASGNGERPDLATRLKQWGEQLQAPRRQQMMRGLAVFVTIGFTAGWIGGRVAARGLRKAR